MGNVISIKANSPHKAGEFVCLSCKHNFTGTSAIGEEFIECPECHTERATHKFPVTFDEDHWSCKCGSSLFSITPTRTYCPNCGKIHTEFN